MSNTIALILEQALRRHRLDTLHRHRPRACVGAVWALHRHSQRDSLSDGFGEGSGECVAKVK